MIKHLLALGIVSASLGLATFSHADSAKSWTGTVKTQSISATTQVGTIDLQTKNKKTEQCSIVGQVVGQDPATGAMLLEHTITCAHGTFSTKDMAFITGQIDACTVSVYEQNSIVSGTGKFEGVRGTGSAQGTLNFCTGENSFNLVATVSKSGDE